MINILKSYVDKTHIEHPDGKCGLCLKESIKADVAEEFLSKNTTVTLGEFYKEVDKRFKETDLYKQVKGLLDSGKTIDEVQEIMAGKGFEI